MENERYSRQSFLGPNAESNFFGARAGLVGLGGGGSHIVQQLAYAGFKKFVLYDGDVGKVGNLNRTIGLTQNDISEVRAKVDVATRIIRCLHPDARIERHQKRWQECPEPLRSCDLIFGCVDGYSERRELEACCRRYLIPYIDIGIDVHEVKPQPPVMSGQVIASIPGGPCMFCLGFLTEEKLAREAAKYGAAGINPQVVWANGVVASTAVGLGIDIVTGWTAAKKNSVYLMYEGNKGEVRPHPRLRQLESWTKCSHFPNHLVGDPQFKKL
jgi:hypothetical protein